MERNNAERVVPLTNSLVLEDFGVAPVWVLSPQLPNVKEWLPVDVGNDLFQVVVAEIFDSEKGRSHWVKKKSNKRTKNRVSEVSSITFVFVLNQIRLRRGILLTPRKYIFDVTSCGQRLSPWPQKPSASSVFLVQSYVAAKH